ncbi:hypothetical protein E3N88_40713 [Mikania micrantha]|uniref:Methyltransferase type 11 domain-containing protein n=1 Tax=Mikania micrantha TaxID=192012 RepID=A0A5N6LNL5_9ASTR|nr:hypothetical protein E3N88_40713 [Mikania micrantha]
MVDWWISLVGAAVPALVAGQAIRMKNRRAEEDRLKSARGREKSSDDIFVCERVCTSKRMLKKVGSFSKDPEPNTCVTVCGVSELDACADACARTVCVNQHQREKLLSNSSKALCLGARVGQEVEALKRVGVNDSVGLDLVPYPPNVIKGDFHYQPFDDETFDFEFSNVFDHALYPGKFVGEIQRTLKPGGICVLHVAVSRRSDKYSANDLYSIEPLKRLFNGSELVRSRKIDGFGLDTEVVFRKRK